MARTTKSMVEVGREWKPVMEKHCYPPLAYKKVGTMYIHSSNQVIMIRFAIRSIAMQSFYADGLKGQVITLQIR